MELRGGSAEPMLEKSRVEACEPDRAMPVRLGVAPGRTWLRGGGALPRCTESGAGGDGPGRAMPWVALLVQLYLSNMASFVFFGVTCMISSVRHSGSP